MIIKTCYTKMVRPNSQKYNKFLKEISQMFLKEKS